MKLNILTSKKNYVLRYVILNKNMTPYNYLKNNSKNDMKKYESRSFSKKHFEK